MSKDIWDTVIEIAGREQPHARLPMMVSRLEKLGERHFLVIAPNITGYDRLQPYAALAADAIRQATGTDAQVDFTYEKPQRSSQPSLFSKPPAGDAQTDLFVPEISELAIKDDVHLMEIAPWTGTPQLDWAEATKRTRITYSIDDMTVDVRGSSVQGLPTHNDYDVVLLMQSWLVREANAYRKARKKYIESGYKGDAPKPPARRFKIHKKDILKFARHGTGGHQYARLEQTLERLKETVVYVEQKGQKRRRRGSFSLIADWQTISKSDSGEIMTVEIVVPEWVYQGIVEADQPSVLTYSRDYFLLKSALARTLYRLGRLNHSKGEVTFELAEVHHRSGSRAPLKEFNRALRNFVHSIAPNTFPDYDLELDGENRKRTLTIRVRDSDVAEPATAS
ncbi:replication initiator protein A [Ochrobactrum sp. S1502_03]|uniref:replication initiator protein A n=1 Tax=Ochrobactrum sp. S1502_03 TaxID=3108451 RepID=UPI0037C804D3